MESHLHLKNHGDEPPGKGPLARQSSVYSLTFDEFLRGSGKDFGSMNMDELLKNIWTAEESQTLADSGVSGQEFGGLGGNLQRQGSLTLPRTLSHKTVDEVWKDISKNDGNDAGELLSMSRRQQTLGEMTLEDFLVRAGVVREEAQVAAKTSNIGVFGDVGFGDQLSSRETTLMASKNIDNNSEIGVKTGDFMQSQQPQQPGLAYGSHVAIPTSGQLSNPGMRGGIVGGPDPAVASNLVQGVAIAGGGMNMVSFGMGGITRSPTVSSDRLGKGNGGAPSKSPVPYAFNGGTRGRKSSAVEKVVERRHRRMIKNRESAARSRARKQAYTMELEAEIAKLTEDNEKLRKKQAEMMEMQKTQIQEMMNLQKGAKRLYLRRTQSGQW